MVCTKEGRSTHHSALKLESPRWSLGSSKMMEEITSPRFRIRKPLSSSLSSSLKYKLTCTQRTQYKTQVDNLILVSACVQPVTEFIHARFNSRFGFRDAGNGEEWRNRSADSSMPLIVIHNSNHVCSTLQ